MESVRELLAGQGFGPGEILTALYGLGTVTGAAGSAAFRYAVAPALGWCWGGAKRLVVRTPDPVFARLMAHFDDPHAEYAPASAAKGESAGRPAALETGTLVVTFGEAGNVLAAKDAKAGFYDAAPDLSDREKKALNARARAKVAEVVERDRQARRAKLSAPKTV